MSVLDSKFDILRGWPGGGAVAIEVKSATVANNVSQQAGTWITLDPAEKVPTVDTAALVTSGQGLLPLLVLEGLEDNSSAMSGTITCLVGGGYVARFHQTADQVVWTDNAELDPGKPVKLAAGKIVASALGGGGLIIGYVLANNAPSGIGTIDILITGEAGKN